jgi:hypothetical protein
MSFDHTRIKNININLNNSEWNPETHDILLTYDPKQLMKFTIKIIKTEEEPILDVSLAQGILNKFKL